MVAHLAVIGTMNTMVSQTMRPAPSASRSHPSSMQPTRFALRGPNLAWLIGSRSKSRPSWVCRMTNKSPWVMDVSIKSGMFSVGT